jgi:predicted solute-binding protein
MFHEPYHTPVIGIPPWSAAAPLLSGLDGRGDLRLNVLPADQLGTALATGQCACALHSPGGLLEDPALCVIPGAGLVAINTDSRERLVTELPLESIRRITVAPGAWVLTLYVQVLFRELRLPVPELVAEEDPQDGDAVLVSGVDGGSTVQESHDVAALWRATTGSPLVLGVWASHGNGPLRLLRQVLGEAARQGEAGTVPEGYTYRLLSGESDGLRTLHRLARHHAIAGASVESIGFC